MNRIVALLLCLVFSGCRFFGRDEALTKPPAAADRAIEIYAQQFFWTVRYSGTDNTLGKANFRFINAQNTLGLDTSDVQGMDDIAATDTFFLPVGEAAAIHLRSRDVIHSVYLPHFRVQLNAVPGMPTTFTFTPFRTTRQMRDSLNDPAFDYWMLCNKICGAKHDEMKMKVVVGTREEFFAWMKRKKPCFGK